MPKTRGEPSDRFTFYWPPEERERMEQIAEAEDRSLAYVLREAARLYAKRRDAQPVVSR